MNQQPDPETETLRSDIDNTRRRMDDTMDALGQRLQGRHLIDEVLGFFRNSTEGRAGEMKDRITRGASNAVHSVVNTVKANPVPVLLIGAGVAWMLYQNRRDKTTWSSDGMETDADDYLDSGRSYDSEHYDRPLEYPTAGSTSSETELSPESGDFGAVDKTPTSKFGAFKDDLQERVSEAKHQVGEKFTHLGEQARDKYDSARSRVGELAEDVKNRSREIYSQSRDKIVSTADEHPLELGLACLAVGVLVGLAIPTPEKVKHLAGPTADRLRNRAREAGSDLLQKGKRVVQSAAHAAKQEAEAQGLMPNRAQENSDDAGHQAQPGAGSASATEGEDQNPGRNVTAGTTRSPTDPSSSSPSATV